jgi:prophage DNA circulation protein
MGNFDLNTQLGFAQATAGNAATVAAQLGTLTGQNPSNWDIVEGSYKSTNPTTKNKPPVLFHIFKSNSPYQAGLPKISDSGGRRKIKYVFPYQDGQTTDDTGRKPQTFQLEIMIFGTNYKIGLNNLLNELNQPYPGTLRHPVRGDIQCVMEDYELSHMAENRSAVLIRLTMIEHNFSLGNFSQQFPQNQSTVKSALAGALTFIAKIQAVATYISNAEAFATSLKQELTSYVNQFQAGFTLLLQQINQAFNNSTSSDIPSLLPVNLGGTATTSTTFNTLVSPSDPFQNAPINSSQDSATPVSTQQAINNVNALRDQANALIQNLESQTITYPNDGALYFYDQILAIKQSMNAMQSALELGIQSSQSTIVNYVTPRLMSIREVAFANGLSLDAVIDIEQLNQQQLLSVNYIAKGTTIQVPTTG